MLAPLERKSRYLNSDRGGNKVDEDMAPTNYTRTVEELHSVASLFWPEELSDKEAEMSVIPKLVETQEKFFAVLRSDVRSIEDFFEHVNSSDIPPNLFLKHLVILADFGGEQLQRINQEFNTFFPSGKLKYMWKGAEREYTFSELPTSGALNNGRMGMTGKKLTLRQELSELSKDVMAILLIGSASTDENTANALSKCEIANYLGDSERLDKFVRQRYMLVSRITGGAQSNTLGQIAQQYVKEYLKNHIGLDNLEVKANSTIPGISHNEAGSTLDTSFDIVVKRGNKYAAVEVSFQVTTNSVIERKSGQAQARYEQIERKRHVITYVIDGAGNFQRESALKRICAFSHCTVAFSNSELDLLCTFLKQHLQ